MTTRWPGMFFSPIAPPRCVGEPRDNRRHYIRMPRYHFHIVDGGVLDTLGATLPTDEAARVHAEKMAHRFTRAEVGKLRAKAVKVTGVVLNSIQESADQAFTTSAVRLSK
jgi:hypothetical protein